MARLFVYTIVLFCLALITVPASVLAQITKITGTIIDNSTREPIPFANIYFKGTTIGATSDDKGFYSITTTTPGDSLTVTVIGYHLLSVQVKKGVTQKIDLSLIPMNIELSEFVVVPDEELIQLMMNWIRKNKKKNSKENIDYYQCEVYSKVQADVNNIDSTFMQRKIFRPFDFVWDYLDTADINGKAYLPILISETMSDVFYRKSPQTLKEIIKANKISGVENEGVTQYLGSMYQNVNIYDNFIFLLDKNFIGPLASFGDMYYNYSITDSVWMNDHMTIEVVFEPKRQHELTFSGTFWVQDSSWAIRKVVMRVSESANLNFVSDLVIAQEYDLVDKKHWMVVRDFMMADFNPLENRETTFGLFIRRTSTFRNYIIDEPVDQKIYNTPETVIVEKDAAEKDDSFWENNRHEALTSQEETIYAMVDTIQHLPVYRTWLDIAYIITSGYYPGEKFDYGPVYKVISFNDIEGVRFRVGARTDEAFSEKFRLEAYTAFGIKDARFKGGASVQYFLSKVPRRTLGFSAKYDLEQLGESANAYSTDNFFASIFKRAPANKLTDVREFKMFYEHDWFTGFSTTLTFIHRQDYPLGETVFAIKDGEDVILKKSIFSSEIQVYNRFAYKEKFIQGRYERTSMGTRYPIVEAIYSYGIPELLNSDYEYHKLTLRLSQWFNVAAIGWSKYVVETGKIWRTLPYNMLKIHEGNESYFFYESSNNMMNYYEFISDKYVSLYYTHHFEGLLTNWLPLIRKLDLRTAVQGKMVIGTLTEANKNYSVFPQFSGSLDYPYYEAGFAVENIFKIIRIDAIWRLSHHEQYTDVFNVFVSLDFTF